MTVKIQLKEVRTARKLSQNELARRLGMSLNNVQKIEYGDAKSIPLETLDKLCKVLECHTGDLLVYVPDEGQP
jgi:putative transcriptional regulator